MGLRLIEVFLAEDQRNRVQEVLKEQKVLGSWEQRLLEGKILIKLLLPAEETGAVLDLLEKHFSLIEAEGFRIIILPVEASIPRPQPEETPPEHEELQPEKKQIRR